MVENENYKLAKNYFFVQTFLNMSSMDHCVTISPLYLVIHYTVCPRSLDPYHIVSYYINWVKTSGTYSIYRIRVQTNLEYINVILINFYASRLEPRGSSEYDTHV